ncbi:MAG: hypothetical protein OEX12_01220 [Gammaproteobacteria bacterium]|nr:hypothetical protein [Gammaproteobacteria bacterium]
MTDIEIIDLVEIEGEREKAFMPDLDHEKGIVIQVEDSAGDLSHLVENKPNYVWVKISSGGVWWVYNEGSNVLPGMPVVLRRSSKPPLRWVIWKIDHETADVMEGYPGAEEGGLKPHANDHVIRDTYIGSDPLIVYRRAIATLRTTATTANRVEINTHRYIYNSNSVFFTGRLDSNDLDLALYQPDPGFIRYVLIVLDCTTNNVAVITGDQTPMADRDIPMPAMPVNAIPSALVRLYNQTAISDKNDIVDIRDMLSGSHGGGLPNGITNPQAGDLLSYDPTNFWVRTAILTDTDGEILVDANGEILMVQFYE